MKMNAYIVLCFLYLVPLSTAATIGKENHELGNELTRQRRACNLVICDPCPEAQETSVEGCKKVGCELYQFGGITCLRYKGKCFPGSAMVTTPTGNVAMETLSVGDSVSTVLENNEVGFTKVVGFAQREPDQEAHFLSITGVNQAGHTHTVKLTATHNIYVKDKFATDKDAYMPRFSEDVLIGDVLKTQINNGTAVNEATVTRVALHKEMGAYAPLTETGTMLVDGTLVSCYASFNDKLVHVLMTPIRWFPWLFAEEKPLDGSQPYVETLKYIGRSYVAPIVSLN